MIKKQTCVTMITNVVAVYPLNKEWFTSTTTVIMSNMYIGVILSLDTGRSQSVNQKKLPKCSLKHQKFLTN